MEFNLSTSCAKIKDFHALPTFELQIKGHIPSNLENSPQGGLLGTKVADLRQISLDRIMILETLNRITRAVINHQGAFVPAPSSDP